VSQDGHQTPPAGEEIHLPGGTLIPLMCAIGITLVVVGTTITFVLSAIGIVVLVVTITIWIRDTRRDVDALPGEHR
jgi:hypothetical protein